MKITKRKLKKMIKESLDYTPTAKHIFMLIGPPSIGKSTWIRENVPDAFPYPLSNTTTQFSTPVENTGDEGVTTKDITIIVSDEYNNDAYINCLITFER